MKRNGIELIEAHIAMDVAEYLRLIRTHVKYPNAWYRGQSLSSYKLEPSLFRTAKLYKNLVGRIGEKSITRPKSGEYLIMDHNIASKIMLGHPNSKRLSTTEIIYQNQHHGVPTRMMDFSSNPLIALFFCVENRKYWNAKHSKTVVRNTLSKYGEYCDTAGAISIIDPLYTNNVSLGVNRIIKTNDDVNKFLNAQTPFAVEPTFVNPRIKAQKGKFICFGARLDEYESYNPFRNRLVKIHIPNKYKESIFNELSIRKINYSTVYPDFEGFAKESNFQMEKEFLSRYRKMMGL